MISNYHVVKDAAQVRLVTSVGTIPAKMVQVDAANDLALLKANAEGGMKNEETFKPLPILPSKRIQLGSTVATVGFPDPGLQGFAPKVLAHGHHGGNCMLSTRGRQAYFQISAVLADGHQAAGQFGRGAGG